jgi:glycosyltransferase involved in cell wall biosynthesis
MDKSLMPRVTVLMPVYNGQVYLREAIDSVIGQTFNDFELLIINDGSTDDTLRILESFVDPRIRLIMNEKNLGLVHCLNQGIEIARGQYVARMDCDDVCMPERLRVQSDFLDSNPSVDICGSWIVDLDGDYLTTFKYPVSHEDIQAQLLFRNPLAHPAIMLRRSTFIAHGLRYEESERHAEDYGLWIRVQNLVGMANIPQVLLHYRRHEDQVSSTKRQEQRLVTNNIRMAQLRTLYTQANIREQKDFLDICAAFDEPHNFIGDTNVLQRWMSLLTTLLAVNSEHKIYGQQSFVRIIELVWERLCRAKGIQSIQIWTLYWQFLAFLRSYSLMSRYLCLLAGTLPVYHVYRLLRRFAAVFKLLPR